MLIFGYKIAASAPCRGFTLGLESTSLVLQYLTMLFICKKKQGTRCDWSLRSASRIIIVFKCNPASLHLFMICDPLCERHLFLYFCDCWLRFSQWNNWGNMQTLQQNQPPGALFSDFGTSQHGKQIAKNNIHVWTDGWNPFDCLSFKVS